MPRVKHLGPQKYHLQPKKGEILNERMYFAQLARESNESLISKDHRYFVQ